MTVRSFLVHVAPGALERVADTLRRQSACDVFPASNRDLLVLVTEHETREAELAFDRFLAETDGVRSMAFVSGYVE